MSNSLTPWRNLVKFKHTMEPVIARALPQWLLPNHLTYVRMALSLVLLGIGLSPLPLTWVLIPAIPAAISDALDGILARARGQTSVMGAYLDPMADKFFALVLMIIISWRGLAETYLLLLALVGDLHAVILPILVYRHRKINHLPMWPPPVIKASRWGKLKTGVLIVSLGLLILSGMGGWPELAAWGKVGLWLAAILGAIALSGYMNRWRLRLIS